jgi:hypothetical protein
MGNQIQQQVRLSVMATQAKARCINEGIKIREANSKPSSWQATAGLEGSRNGRFNRFKHRACFHNVKVCGKVASTDTAAAEKFCYVLEKNCVFIKEALQRNKFLTLTKTAVYWNNRPHCTCIGKQETTVPGFKILGNALAWGPMYREITD